MKPSHYEHCRVEDSGLCASDIHLPYYKRFLSPSELAHMRYDSEGLRMSIPQSVGQIVAQRIPGHHVIDLCCGVGSFAISLALAGKQVVAVDTNHDRLEIARQNAKRFQVDDRIDFRLQDCRQFVVTEISSSVFFDPPWGGSARRLSEFTLSNFQFDIRPILDHLIESGHYLAMKLPFNFSFLELNNLSSEWRYTAIRHDRLAEGDDPKIRPLFWLAEHSV